MEENEIITQEDPQMQMFAQLMEGILKKLERYCATAHPMLGGEVYLTGEEVCSQLRLSIRTLQEYRNLGTLPFYKIGGKILYKQSDIQTMLEKHYNAIPKKLWQE
ncbi:helix-turn-helix domain-containing protein [Prevotella aurantiaca JCM 15754]|uniref:helix-turn-helix domain-containing protein n=1 Tax=Prevotella aurantiaca TaxID=596085 RepID=UPI0004682816|nr:helix-turn-helix domain-containing protein [Prevotella aurantiaca]